MKIIVTGGTGYIGCQIVKRLATAGHSILSLSRSEKPEHFYAKHIICDITSVDQLKTIDAKGYDLLIHLAAQPSAVISNQKPRLDIETNILGTLNAIELCKTWNIPRILLASTWNVYGTSCPNGKLIESQECHPISVYGLSKLSAEQLLEIYAQPIGLSWNILRLFNVYGPGQDSNKTGHGVVDIFWERLAKDKYLALNGTLDRYRDFIYIDDVITAWQLIAENVDNPNQIYNVGSGIKTDYRLLVSSITKLIGMEGAIRIDELAFSKGDIFGGYADISKITCDLGFKPTHNLDEGLKKILAWKQRRKSII